MAGHYFYDPRPFYGQNAHTGLMPMEELFYGRGEPVPYWMDQRMASVPMYDDFYYPGGYKQMVRRPEIMHQQYVPQRGENGYLPYRRPELVRDDTDMYRRSPYNYNGVAVAPAAGGMHPGEVMRQPPLVPLRAHDDTWVHTTSAPAPLGHGHQGFRGLPEPPPSAMMPTRSAPFGNGNGSDQFRSGNDQYRQPELPMNNHSNNHGNNHSNGGGHGTKQSMGASGNGSYSSQPGHQNAGSFGSQQLGQQNGSYNSQHGQQNGSYNSQPGQQNGSYSSQGQQNANGSFGSQLGQKNGSYNSQSGQQNGSYNSQSGQQNGSYSTSQGQQNANGSFNSQSKSLGQGNGTGGGAKSGAMQSSKQNNSSNSNSHGNSNQHSNQHGNQHSNAKRYNNDDSSSDSEDDDDDYRNNGAMVKKHGHSSGGKTSSGHGHKMDSHSHGGGFDSNSRGTLVKNSAFTSSKKSSSHGSHGGSKHSSGGSKHSSGPASKISKLLGFQSDSSSSDDDDSYSNSHSKKGSSKGTSHGTSHVSSYQAPNYGSQPKQMQFSSQSKSVELQVPICCDNCERKVRTCLEKMDGVESVLCDQWNRKVIVYGNVKAENVLKRVRRVKKFSELWQNAKQNHFQNQQHQLQQLQQLRLY